MRKTLSLLLTIAMAVTMVFGSAGSVFAADSTAATTMKIAGTDGTVTITNEKGKDVPANVDTKLLNGYTIKTAAASYCFISLDDSKAIKLGQNTKVKVEKSGKKIELNVKNGEIFFDVDKKLSGNESMNIKTGNMTTGIRGTSGILKTIKQGQSSIDLFQLFSGKTEMKANTQKNVQNIIERILGVLGVRTQTQTVTANAQVLESTTATAGQQIAITGMAPEASAQVAPTFERQALTVSEFGTRSILESAAIKGGMSAGEALAADTGAIVAKVGDVTQTLENAGVAQAAIDQVEGAAADPAKLDEAVKNAELQAAVDQILTEQGIDTAKDEAAKVDGTTSNAGESKVLDKVEVKTDSGANASGLTLSDDGTSAVATADDRQKTNSGSHSGGSSGGSNNGIPESGYLTGYTGAFDYFSQGPKRVFTEDPSVKFSESDIFVFKTVEEYTSFAAVLADAKANYEEVKVSLAEAGEPEPDYYSLVVEQYLLYNNEFRDNYCNEHDISDNRQDISEVMYVADSGDYPYYAIGNTAPYEEKTGTLHVRISRKELEVRWVDASGNEVTGNSGTFPSDTAEIPVSAQLGIVSPDGIFEPISMDIAGFDDNGQPTEIFTLAPGYASGFELTANSGTVKVNCIAVTTQSSIGHGIPIVDSEPEYVYETPNFCLTGVYEYNYTIEPGWITGYTGTYDGQDHPAFNLTNEQANNYYIFCLKDNRTAYQNIETSWSALRSNQALSLDEKIVRLTEGGFGSYLYDPVGDHRIVCHAYDTGRYLYYAIPKDGNVDGVKKGGAPISIEPADLYIGWGSYDPDTEGYTYVESGSTIELNPYGEPNVAPYFYTIRNGENVGVSLARTGEYIHEGEPIANSDGTYTIRAKELEIRGKQSSSYVPIIEGKTCSVGGGDYNLHCSNLTCTYRLAEGNPVTSQPILSSNIVGFADGYPQVACREDGFNITLKLAEAADTEVYGIFVGKPGNGYPDSYDVLHGHSNYVNQASALVYGRIDSADEESISIDFTEWQEANAGAYFAFILKQDNVISREPVFVAANPQSLGLHITGTENARDTVAPRIRSAYMNGARNKIIVEMSEDVAVPTNGEGFGFTGGTGTISSVGVSTAAGVGDRTRYFMELGVESLEGMNMGLTYNGTAVKDTSNNPLAAITAENAIPIQDSAVNIDSVAASEDRSLIRVDLTGRLLDATANGTYMIKYGTDWDTATQIQGSDMDWTDELRWNDSHTQQLGTTFFHIDEEWVPSPVPEGRFFVRLNSGSKTMALETIEVNAEPVEAASTLVATTQEPSPSAVYDSSDETLTVSFATGSMLEAGSSIVGGAVNCRFYIIDGDGKLFRLRGNYTDRGVHSLVFDNTGDFGMSGFGFDPDEVNWEGATLGYTSGIHNDDPFIGYFDELLAADGTIITELTDISITVV